MKQTNHMEYMDDMEQIQSDIMPRVLSSVNSYDYNKYTKTDALFALNKDNVSIRNFAALLSPAAELYLEDMARKAQAETRKHFGTSVSLFTPLYISNYCENHCVYCGNV